MNKKVDVNLDNELIERENNTTINITKSTENKSENIVDFRDFIKNNNSQEKIYSNNFLENKNSNFIDSNNSIYKSGIN